MLVYVSTVDSHWALLSFRSKRTCGANDPSIDGVWVAKRTTSGRWVGTGWIWGDREGFCEELAAAGIPAAAFKDLDQFKRFCTK